MHRFAQVDVFTARPFLGNPLAVVLDADNLSSEEMQRIARWTNLSETAFVLAPTVAGAHYQARIFAYDGELPFAGHPTLGTAHAVLDTGLASPSDGRLRMQCRAGVVEITVGADGLSFRLPRHAIRPTFGTERLPAALGATGIIGAAETIDTGPHWLVARVADVAAVSPDAAGLHALIDENQVSGLTIYAETSPGEIAVRTFFFTGGLMEDPICGSGNAAVAVHRLRSGAIGGRVAYRARQGQQIGRDGTVHVRIEEGVIHVGGQCVTCVRGEIFLPRGEARAP